MNKLMISTAIAGILALAAPALAQDRGDRGGRDRSQAAQPAQPAAPQQAPAQGNRPQDNGRYGRGSGPAPAAQNTPAPAPAAAATAPNNDRRAQGNDNRGNDRRDFGNNNNNRNFGNNNNRGPTFGNNNRGARQDFSAFHRNFTAPRRFHTVTYRRPSGWYSHRWTFGEMLPSLFWAPQYWLNDYDYYGLAPPPPGTVWVRDGDDALLIDRYTGEIIQVDYSVFF